MRLLLYLASTLLIASGPSLASQPQRPNILVVMVSNYTRLIGYFHDSHTVDRPNWQTLHFNSEESPMVDHSYVERIESRHGLAFDLRHGQGGVAGKAG